jgi:sulfonate transport system permease protein
MRSTIFGAPGAGQEQPAFAGPHGADVDAPLPDAPPASRASATRRSDALASPWLQRAGGGLLPWLFPLALLALWYQGAAHGWIPAQVLPSPAYVAETLMDLARSGDLWMNVQASMQRVIVGFGVGAALGLALGTAMGLSRSLEAYVLPTFNALVQIPVLAWLPFVLMLVGIGETLKFILIAKAALVPVTLNTVQGFRQAPDTLLEVARAYGFTRRQTVLEVVLPSAVPTLFTGLRLGFTKAWLSLVVVELVASSEGLGYLIVYGRQLFQLDLVMAAVVVVGAIGYAIDRVLDLAESRVLHGRRATFGGVR